jgi:hypothetical protein
LRALDVALRDPHVAAALVLRDGRVRMPRFDVGVVRAMVGKRFGASRLRITDLTFALEPDLRRPRRGRITGGGADLRGPVSGAADIPLSTLFSSLSAHLLPGLADQLAHVMW